VRKTIPQGFTEKIRATHTGFATTAQNGFALLCGVAGSGVRDRYGRGAGVGCGRGIGVHLPVHGVGVRRGLPSVSKG
jgi:hypothetical protein